MLPYTADVLAALAAQLNAALWPLHLGLLLLTALAVLHAWRPAAGGDRAIGTLLAIGWGWVAWIWFWRGMAPLDFLAPVYAGLFGAQAVLLLPFALAGRLAFRLHEATFPAVGLGLLALAAVGLPLFGFLSGRSLLQLEVMWLAPTPTALATLGLLFLVRQPPRILLAVPCAWALIGGAIAWTLGMPAALLGSVALLAGAGLAVLRR